MDPQTQFCHNPACRARGQIGQGTMQVHSRKSRRYRCRVCRQTCSATKDTPFYRLHTPAATVTQVLTLLSHGCPVPAIVAAFGLDERTVADWALRAGEHSQQVHAQLVQRGQLDLGQVQADELWVKLIGRTVWLALALAGPSRLWLGGVVSDTRDAGLIRALVGQVRVCAAAGRVLLVCVDGLASYVRAFQDAFRRRVPTGRRGRPRLVPDPGLLIGQVVKHRTGRRVTAVTRRIVQGTPAAITAALAATAGTVLNTASIERFNATWRGVLVPLTRRGRALARKDSVVTAGMYLVGCAYNFCWVHASLRQPAPPGATLKWQARTPAMAAGLTDHVWTMSELLHDQVPLPAWVAPTKRGRPRKAPIPVGQAAAA